MRFGVLGPLAVWTDAGTPVRVPEAKVRTLLAVLLTSPGRPVSTDRLIDALWGDRPPRNPKGTLQARVSQLRRVLDEAEPGARDLIASRPPGYVLDVDPEAVDAGRFTAALARARETADPLARARTLGDALALWRGPAFADAADAEFARGTITRLEENRLTALEEHAETRLGLGDHAALAADLAEAVQRHPLRERLRAAHLRALHGAGRRDEALMGYHDLRERLADDLGVDPGPDLTALYRSMLDEDPSLEPGGRGVPAGAEPAAPPLPVPLDELIGREHELRRARALLADHRLVTLTGTGGVGKTRLALETAARTAAAHPGGVWMVELASVRPATAGAAAEHVARAIGLRDEASAGPVERLGAALRGRRALLVLDNCEHVVEPVAELAGRLLGAAPGLRVLVTSREPLGVPAERLLVVPPLDLPGPDDACEALRGSGAVRLFTARAAAAAPGFVLDDATAPWVASICRRLDGVPLALELAATRVRALGVRELAARLDDRFRVLADARHGGPARQRTLRAVIDWSWELLTEPERVALRRLVVHAGGCTLEAAEAVCGTDAGVLARLVDRSLVARTGDGRYRLLESVAAYGLERLREAGEEDEYRRRHAEHHTGLAERAAEGLRGPEQPRWLERLDRETANLDAALDTALGAAPDRGEAVRLANALGWYWYLRGRFDEARRAFTRALASGGGSAPARAEAAAWLAGFTMLSGADTDSEELRRTALKDHEAALDDHEDAFAQAKAEWFLSHAHWAYGDLAANEARVDRALSVFRARGDRWFTAAALATRAVFAMGRGDLAAMERDAEESLALFDAIGDPWGRLQAGDALARRAEIAGDHDEAARIMRDGLRVAEDLRMWPEASLRLSGLGRMALLKGDLDAAHELHVRALELARRRAARSAEEFAEIGLGIVARARGDLDAAETHLRAWLGWLHEIGGTAGLAFLRVQLGYVAEERGDAAAAAALHAEGLADARATGDPRAVALALEGLAGARSLAGEQAGAAGDPAKADALLAEARALLDEATALRASAGAPLPAGERRDVDRALSRINDRS